MSAPTITPIGTPAMVKLKEGGQRAVIVFRKKPNVSFWITAVKPGGFDRGGPINTTTQFNTKYHSKAKKALMDILDTTATCGYNPSCLDDIMDMADDDDDDSITLWWPDGSAWVFWGFLDKFVPGDLTTGEFPTAAITVVATMEDPTTGAEEDMLYITPAGT